MNNDPKISVVLSVYNGEKFIAPAIESILAQSEKNFEFIIINDGSTDSTASVLKSFTDPRIKIVSRENRGLVSSLNEGIALARGKYIARMDADDISFPNRLKIQSEFLDNHPDISLCGTWAATIDENGKQTGEIKTPITHEEIKKMIFWHNPILHPTVIFRKEILKTTGGYDNKYKHAEDYELWTRIVVNYQTANLPEFLLKYRITQESITATKNEIMRAKGILIRLRLLKNFIWKTKK